MSRPTTSLAVVAGLILAASALSAPADGDKVRVSPPKGPPNLQGIRPLGVRRGTLQALVFRGKDLWEGLELVAPFAFEIESAVETGGDAWSLMIRVDPETPIGVYPVRVRSSGGLSNPILMAVGQLVPVAEAEPNDSFESAQVIEVPAAVEGEAKGNDVDFFRFEGREGERIVVDAQCVRLGSGVDPTIRLTTAGRDYVASADDSPGLRTDARIVATLPEDGEYVIELSDSQYQGGDRPIYRVLVGALPIADEVYPLGGRRGETVGFEFRGGTLDGVGVVAATLADPDGDDSAVIRAGGIGPMPDFEVESVSPRVVGDLPELREPTDPEAPPLRVAAPIVLNGRIDPPGEDDRFLIAVSPGQKLRIRVEAADLGSALDGQIQVLGAKGAVIASGDDSNLPPLESPAKAAAKSAAKKSATILSPDPSLEVTVPAGLDEITLVLRDLEGRGGIGFPYRLIVEPAAPDFQLRMELAEASIPRGGTVAVEVWAVRQGFDGPIVLGVAGPPDGLVVGPGTIAPGQASGVLTLSAAPDADFETMTLRIEGRAESPGGPLVRRAECPLVFAQQGNVPLNLAMQIGLLAAPAPPGRVTLEVPVSPIQVVHGHEVSFSVRIVRDEGAEADLEVSAMLPPPGLTVAKAKVEAKASEVQPTIKAAPEAPLGRTAIVLIADGKLDREPVNVAAPAVQVEVVRPVIVELEASGSAVEVAAGRTVEVRGRLVRNGPFREPVTLKLNGLPAGLDAEPMTVGPDDAEFALVIEAKPDVKAATADVQLAISLKLADKDYKTPPLPLTVKVLPPG